MSANDLIATIKELGFFDELLVKVQDMDLYSEEDLACYLTALPHRNVLEYLCGTKHELTLKFNDTLNEKVYEANDGK